MIWYPGAVTTIALLLPLPLGITILFFILLEMKRKVSQVVSFFSIDTERLWSVWGGCVVGAIRHRLSGAETSEMKGEVNYG